MYLRGWRIDVDGGTLLSDCEVLIDVPATPRSTYNVVGRVHSLLSVSDCLACVVRLIRALVLAPVRLIGCRRHAALRCYLDIDRIVRPRVAALEALIKEGKAETEKGREVCGHRTHAASLLAWISSP
jgi:hypothetical protein